MIVIPLAHCEQVGGGASELLAVANDREEEPPECSLAEHPRGNAGGERAAPDVDLRRLAPRSQPLLVVGLVDTLVDVRLREEQR